MKYLNSENQEVKHSKLEYDKYLELKEKKNRDKRQKDNLNNQRKAKRS